MKPAPAEPSHQRMQRPALHGDDLGRVAEVFQIHREVQRAAAVPTAALSCPRDAGCRLN
jgi:hypothetical protein